MINSLPEQPRIHLERGHDSHHNRDFLEILGYDAEIAVKGKLARSRPGKRRPVKRCHSWMNG